MRKEHKMDIQETHIAVGLWPLKLTRRDGPPDRPNVSKFSSGVKLAPDGLFVAATSHDSASLVYEMPCGFA